MSCTPLHARAAEAASALRRAAHRSRQPRNAPPRPRKAASSRRLPRSTRSGGINRPAAPSPEGAAAAWPHHSRDGSRAPHRLRRCSAIPSAGKPASSTVALDHARPEGRVASSRFTASHRVARPRRSPASARRPPLRKRRIRPRPPPLPRRKRRCSLSVVQLARVTDMPASDHLPGCAEAHPAGPTEAGPVCLADPIRSRRATAEAAEHPEPPESSSASHPPEGVWPAPRTGPPPRRKRHGSGVPVDRPKTPLPSVPRANPASFRLGSGRARSTGKPAVSRTIEGRASGHVPVSRSVSDASPRRRARRREPSLPPAPVQARGPTSATPQA
jgi:hypothetical protein